MSDQKRLDSFKTRRTLNVGHKSYDYFSLKAAAQAGVGDVSNLPFSLKVLLENLLRNEDGFTVFADDIKAMGEWTKNKKSSREINYYPARVLMQDFTGVPAVVDLAAMRDAMKLVGGDPQKINPLVPVDLVIDHSVIVDHAGTPESFEANKKLEYQRNGERYKFLKWGQKAFKNFRVVPPGTGICHQVNLEYLAQTVWTKTEGGKEIAYCDTCVGTDSHTTMVNGLSVLGWGVGGIEAEAAMLGQAVTMLIPEVVGMKLTGKVREGVTATDVVLTVTQILRKKGVVDKFVEFYGPGLRDLTLADRATIANMAPEYGATCGFFPIDEKTIEFLRFTGRDEERVQLVEAYAKEQGLWRDDTKDPVFTENLELDLASVEPSLAGPKRPQDKVTLSHIAHGFKTDLVSATGFKVNSDEVNKAQAVDGKDFTITHGDVMIAAITSCTNTSNPSVMIGAGLVAKKANALGLKIKPWVKTSLAPGSQVVTDYLEAAGLQSELDRLGFNLVGYGCTTCIGNSGPLRPEFSKAIKDGNLTASAVLSGNRNFEGRVSPDVKANYLASPPLVVAYAIAGNVKIDLTKEPIGKDNKGAAVYLKDIWPSSAEVQEAMSKAITPAMFKSRYGNVFAGDSDWQKVSIPEGETFAWDADSTYINNPPYFKGMKKDPEAVRDIIGASILGLFGDSITTDHISPAGSFKPDTPAGAYLVSRGVNPSDFNQYGARRGHDEVMTRGTFSNIRLKNEMVKSGKEGGVTTFIPSGEETTIYDASFKYQAQGKPLVIVAGKEYGTGSSRDWAAKGTRLLGIKAVITESFERIHRSNLIGMGVIPLQFTGGQTRKTLNLDGSEEITLTGLADMKPKAEIRGEIKRKNGEVIKVTFHSRIDTANELEYYKNSGILHYVLRKLNA
ncbi:MAG TPA: aconitate hydratase AcnA [Bacteriovoracaceae bacterium]|nr:aconitate hydratase AcnA [Bacteriovoracaceae bacterium]